MRIKDKIGMRLILMITAIAVFSMGYASAAENVKQVVIKGVTGIVDVKKVGTDKWVPAEKGMKLTSGDAVKTTIDSVVDLAFADGSVIRLNEETTLTVENLSENIEKGRFLYFFNRNVAAKKTKFKLDEGSIMASVREVGNSKSEFTVETPKGIAGVRGTNWEVGDNTLAVVSGFIDWITKGNVAKGPKGEGDLFTSLRRFLNGDEGRELQNYDFYRINEGGICTIGKDGDVENLRTLDDNTANRITNFVNKEVGPEATTTHSQAASDKYFDKEVLGEPGATDGTQTFGRQNNESRPEIAKPKDLPPPDTGYHHP